MSTKPTAAVFWIPRTVTWTGRSAAFAEAADREADLRADGLSSNRKTIVTYA